MPAFPPLPPNAALRWAVVAGLVDRLAPATILEIGCGMGAFGARLSGRADYLGIEPDVESFSAAQRRIRAAGGEIRNITSSQLASETTYDLVCAFEVLEHIEDDVAELAAWRRLIAPGGHLLVSMPAWQQRFNHWDAMVGHYRRYSPEGCPATFAAAGYQDIEVTLYGWPLGYATEWVRSRIAKGRASSSEDADRVSMGERTAGSGRLLQPRTLAGLAGQAAVAPFVALQRYKPDRGTGLVVLARPS